MAKRVKKSRVSKWMIGGVGTGAILLIGYLAFLGVIEITGYSGNMSCAGTPEDPCFAFINFTTKEDVFIYPNESWDKTSFDTEPEVKEIRMYRSWGEGWREIKLNETCKGTWCGGKRGVKDNAYSFAFRRGKDYQIMFKAYKHNPADIVKWGFADINYFWNGNVTAKKVKIANWNLQIFGNKKASNDTLLQIYASIIDDYDIIFIQEIRNKDQTAFPKLCNLLPDYACNVSSRAGRTTSKEQYGIIYRRGITIESWKDFNPDTQDRWERPPVEVTFNVEDYKIIAYNIHIKPSDVTNELAYLEDVVRTDGNVIVLGDLNADCSYYNPVTEIEFDSWNWIIQDNEDTTVATTDCAYDRIIMNDDAYQEYVSYEIFTEGITKDVSDHYLVWVEIETGEK
ncbi:MAG: endonuclease/exonuclease/phosphatase family protein [Nanoarchaeota archaeon]|nr:endonuclease/exonuclease/phosphatase family protein [Nanoarchaeota archaeon]